MAKLQDMFTQARRAQGGGGMGFLGKSKATSGAHAAALVVKFPKVTVGSAEAALKAGADGLLFTWDGKDRTLLERLKQEIDSAKTSNEQVVSGLQITAGWENLDHDSLTHLKDLGLQYIILPFNAPARLLALESKDVERVVTIPMRSGDMYPLFIRNLTALDGIAAVLLDFGLTGQVGSLTIEDILNYRAVREAVRFPAFLNVGGSLSEGDAYTLLTLSIQAVVLTASETEETTRKQIKALREVLEKTHKEEKDTSTPSIALRKS